jgi:regulatory protein
MDSDLYERLLNCAFHFVSFRPRSVKELRIFLRKKIKKPSTENDTIFEKVMGRLKELDYANDEKFAIWLIESRQKHAPKGIRAIRQELVEKGIDKDLIESLLVNDFSDVSVVSQKVLAEKAIEKKLHMWDKYPVIIRKKKIYEFLMRRGFDGTTISSVIDGVFRKDYNTTIE